MTTLTESSNELTRLILEGRTIEALERFYAPDVQMQENDHPPRIGKDLCIETEMDNLARVSTVTPILLSQEIDEKMGTVRTAWEFNIVYKDGTEYRLNEVSVQQWKKGMVSRERFTYGRD